LKEETVTILVELMIDVGMDNFNINDVKNKELKCKLYIELGTVPENNVEFLRVLVYKMTESALLIQDRKTIDMLKEDKFDVWKIQFFKAYDENYGYENLAKIFLRFKNLFLACKGSKQMNKIINKLRKLAIDNHVPMKQDYLNNVTSLIKTSRGKIDITRLISELEKCNLFRVVRLLNSLVYAGKEHSVELYKIRNGKMWVKEKEVEEGNVNVRKAFNQVAILIKQYIVSQLRVNVNGKKVYYPANIDYALPTSQKNFIGNVPLGTTVTVNEGSLLVGVNWKNFEGGGDGNRVDLDLSLVSTSGKIGWDGDYRNSALGTLFSGDVTDAKGENGATEIFKIDNSNNESMAYILNLNYYNASNTDSRKVPYKLFVCIDNGKMVEDNKNYMIDPNQVVSCSNHEIGYEGKQCMLGFAHKVGSKMQFVFTESVTGNRITAYSGGDRNTLIIDYMKTYYKDNEQYMLKAMLQDAGVEFVEKSEECDINLSMESLEVDTILDLFMEKEE